jgi:hypothetical protein
MKIISLLSIITLLRFLFLVISQEVQIEDKTLSVYNDVKTLDHLNTLIETGKGAQDVVDIIQQHTDREAMPFQILLARAYVQMGLKKEAEKILLKCFRDDTSSTEVTRLLGSYYLQYQRYSFIHMSPFL